MLDRIICRQVVGRTAPADSSREKSPPLNRLVLSWAIASAILGVLGSATPVAARDNAGSQLVVVLYPEANDGSPGSALADRGIRSTFAKNHAGKIQIHNEYLDVTRFPDPQYRRELAGFLQRKYANRKIDLVIAGLATALDFALEYRDQIFPNVPVVFCAVDRKEVAERALPPDVIGIPIQMDLAGSLATALQTVPGTQNVFVVIGRAKFDAFWEAEAKRAFWEYEKRVEITYLSGLPMAELLDRVAHLPAHSLIYYLHVFEDGDGQVHMPADVLEVISARANAPAFSHVDSYIGRGVVGGRVFGFGAAGEDAAGLGLRILAGERADAIGIQPASATEQVFDWRQLQRWQISTARLPPGSLVRYQQPGVWDLYKWQITALVSLCAAQAVLIVGLFAGRTIRARAEQRFTQAVNAAPNGMLMVGSQGEILLANRQVETLFGYSSQELIGQPAELLVPERYRGSHAELRRTFFRQPAARSMGTDSELYGRRKDGSEFPVEIALNPLRTERGVLVLASIIDITERCRAEQQLHESQAALRELTGRLLSAQESERRRIARELHDDLGQSLALLSVELDLLCQRPPDTTGQLVANLQGISELVKRLSSSIHDLSHQLHPMKLEQLGLVAAVRSLCKELGQAHGIPIEFTHDSIPETIPHEESLCLYRIAQEALQNVIKHSRAKKATVELRGREDEMILGIQDDGVGIDLARVSNGDGLGLASMAERVRLVGGEIAIQAGSSGGTRVDARVPLSDASSVKVELHDVRLRNAGHADIQSPTGDRHGTSSNLARR